MLDALFDNLPGLIGAGVTAVVLMAASAVLAGTVAAAGHVAGKALRRHRGRRA